MWAIIGGSGFENFEEFESLESIDTQTPFGPASSGLRYVKINGTKVIFLSRHGSNHELLPSEINYRANIYALKKAGAKAIVSFSAIGSLEKELKPGDMVVPNQYIDRTKGIRQHSFMGEGLVGHVSLAKPVSSSLTNAVRDIASSFDFDIHFDKTYVCIEGPYFSTAAESHWFRSMKANIIGMTNFPEYALAREAGLSYLPCCFVTDYDCWDHSIPHVTVSEVLKVMKENNSKAFGILKLIITKGPLWESSSAKDQGLRSGLFTPNSAIPKDKLPWIETLKL